MRILCHLEKKYRIQNTTNEVIINKTDKTSETSKNVVGTPTNMAEAKRIRTEEGGGGKRESAQGQGRKRNGKESESIRTRKKEEWKRERA